MRIDAQPSQPSRFRQARAGELPHRAPARRRAASRSSISRTTRTSSRSAIKEYLPSTLRAAQRTARRSRRSPSSDLAVFRDGMKCFFEEGRALARLSHPNVVRVLELLPRERDRVPGDALRARPHAAASTSSAHRGALDELWMRNTFAQLLNGLREVHTEQAAAPRHQAGQRLPAQRRHAAADRFRRRAPGALGRGHEAAADSIRRASPRPSMHAPARRCSGPGATSIRSAPRMYACLVARRAAAGERSARRRTTRGAGAAGLGRQVFARPARHRSTGACASTI